MGSDAGVVGEALENNWTKQPRISNCRGDKPATGDKKVSPLTVYLCALSDNLCSAYRPNNGTECVSLMAFPS